MTYAPIPDDEPLDLFNSLTHSDFVLLDGQKRRIVYYLGYPVIDAIMDGDFVVKSRLFSPCYYALFKQSKRFQKKFLSPKYRKFFPNDDDFGDEFPVPQDVWLEEIGDTLEDLMTEDVFDLLHLYTMRYTVAEWPQTQKCREQMIRIACTQLQDTLPVEDVKCLDLKIGRRNFHVMPLVYDDEKDAFLFVLQYGSAKNPVTLATFWSNEDVYWETEPELSSFFNYEESDLDHPWMQIGRVTLPEIFMYIEKHPEVCDARFAKERREAFFEMIFSIMCDWLEPIDFLSEVAETTDWFDKVGFCNIDGHLSLTFAQYLAFETFKDEMPSQAPNFSTTIN